MTLVLKSKKNNFKVRNGDTKALRKLCSKPPLEVLQCTEKEDFLKKIVKLTGKNLCKSVF